MSYMSSPAVAFSTRRLLTLALQMARTAVELDAMNLDPYQSFVAYGSSMSLLRLVITKVAADTRMAELRAPVGEEEVRRLVVIVRQ